MHPSFLFDYYLSHDDMKKYVGKQNQQKNGKINQKFNFSMELHAKVGTFLLKMKKRRE